MAQFKDGVVRVVNGTPIIYGSLTAVLTTPSGAFTEFEALTFSGGSAGFLNNVTGNIATYFITGATPPADGETMTGGSSTETAVINNPASQTKWLTNTILSTYRFVIPNDDAPKVYSLLADATEEHRLAISSNYTGLTKIGVSYGLTKDFTARQGYPRPQPGDVGTASIVSRALDEIDADYVGEIPIVPTFHLDWTGSLVYWKHGGIAYLRGYASSATEVAPSTITTLPLGYRPLYGHHQFLRPQGSGGGVVVVQWETDGELKVQFSDAALSTSFALTGMFLRVDA